MQVGVDMDMPVTVSEESGDHAGHTTDPGLQRAAVLAHDRAR